MHYFYPLYFMFQNGGQLKLNPNQIIMASETAFMRKRLGYNWTDYKTNTDIIN